MSFLAALLLAQAAPAASPAAIPAPMPMGDELATQIEASDARLFWGFFEGCDPDAVEDLLHPDYRMIHDLGGQVSDNADAMLAEARRQCAARLPGGRNEGYKNRRLLTPGSRTIKPMGQWGALEEGYHTFFEWRGAEAGWEQTGGARYIHVWQWMPQEARFRLLESLSVDHTAAPAYPPALD